MSRFGHLFDRFRTARSAEPDQTATPSMEDRWLIAGLGNPGDQYRRSRHNLGFMVAGLIASRAGVDLNRRKFNGLYAEARVDSGSIIIVTPQTYYNRSGDCLSSMIGYFKIPPERLIVVHDEMDLPAGQIRIKHGGSDAGNRGVRSIAQALGTPDFIRVRIGIAHPEDRGESIDHVIRPLTSAELREFEPVIDRATDAVFAIMRDGLDRAMGIYNQRVTAS